MSVTLIDLLWLPVQQRVLLKVIILRHQANHKIAPQYLYDLTIFYSIIYNLLLYN